MVLVHVILSPNGIHKAEVVMLMDEEEGREFYSRLRPHLTHLDQRIGDLKISRQRSERKCEG